MSKAGETDNSIDDSDEIYEPRFKRVYISGDENLQQLQEKLQESIEQNSLLQEENDKLKANILWNKAKDFVENTTLMNLILKT